MFSGRNQFFRNKLYPTIVI